MTVGEDVRLHRNLLSHRSLNGKQAPVNLGAHSFDDDSSSSFFHLHWTNLSLSLVAPPEKAS